MPASCAAGSIGRCNLPYFASLLFFGVNLLGAAASGLPSGAPLGNFLTHPGGAFFASIVILGLTAFMHARGFGIGKWFPVVGATLSIGLLFFVLWAGFFLASRDGSATHFATRQLRTAVQCQWRHPVVDHGPSPSAGTKVWP